MHDNDIPKLKSTNEEVSSNEVSSTNNEKIEIPQEYYAKIEKEKQERIQKLAEEEKKNEELKGSGATFIYIILNALAFFGLLYIMINKTRYAIFAIPGYIFLVSVISSLSKKKENSYNVTVLISGMLLALVSFIIAMSNKEKEDVFIYYAMASAVIGFIGYVLSSVICKLIGERGKIKALETIFYILIIGAMIGGPYYLYTNYKEEFVKIVFNEKDAIEATTEDEFIVSNLKNRYKSEVSCEGVSKNYIDNIYKRIVTVRNCKIGGINSTINTLVYDSTNVEYIVKDTLLDDLYIKNLKKELKDELTLMFNSSKVSIGLYPDNKCYFVGDCENNENYVNEINIDNLYNYGRELELSSYLNLTKEEFFNKYGFRLNILVKGNFLIYDTNTLDAYVKNIISLLVNKGYKNEKGFEIILEDSETLENIYHVKGDANNNQSFENYEMVIDD